MTTPVKRKPGRPRTTQVIQQADLKRIITEHPNPNCRAELVYNGVANIKKLFNMLKSDHCREVIFYFAADGLRIKTINHTSEVSYHIFINGNAISQYYCKQPVFMVVQREKLDHISVDISANNHVVKFLVTDNERVDTVLVTLTDAKASCESTHSVTVIARGDESVRFGQSVATPTDMKHEITPDAYAMEFSLPAKNFKTTISTNKGASANICFERKYDSCLQILSNKAESIENCKSFTDEVAIKMKSRIKPGEIVCVKIPAAYIKPTSSLVLSPDIGIKISNEQPALFEILLDSREIDKIVTPAIRLLTVVRTAGNGVEPVAPPAPKKGRPKKIKEDPLKAAIEKTMSAGNRDIDSLIEDNSD
jgi:hypothetical protein